MTSQVARNDWFPLWKAVPNARLRLFCFAYAGGSAVIFRTWHDFFAPHKIEVCALQLPGHGARVKEPPFTAMPALVDATAEALIPWLTGPFVFFGHSMGGAMSFELARKLRRERQPEPLTLIVSGRRAPHIPPEAPLHHLPEQEFIAELRKLKGTPEEVLKNKELLEMVLPVLRADFRILETYVYEPEPPIQSPIVAMGGLGDDEVSREQLQAWQQHTSGKFSLRMFPGDHFYLHQTQPMLLQAILETLYPLLESQPPRPAAVP